jgi:H+/Cl- antiporter ClcA
MTAVFSALFGTPLTAAVFSLEVIRVGIFNYAGLLPCIISAITAFGVSGIFGLAPVRFNIAEIAVEPFSSSKVLVLAILCALVSILFCVSIHRAEKYMKKFFSNVYLRTVVGAILVVLLSLVFSSGDYNGAGTEVIARAMEGNVKTEAFIVKIIFTAITIAAGFKGGEIVPAFFVGSTFGCMVAPIVGLDASLAAAVGFVSLFCGVVNCPLASLLLAYEVFGGTNILFFAIVCGVSYMMSGYFGLYNSQQFVYSKLTAEKIEK